MKVKRFELACIYSFGNNFVVKFDLMIRINEILICQILILKIIFALILTIYDMIYFLNANAMQKKNTYDLMSSMRYSSWQN